MTHPTLTAGSDVMLDIDEIEKRADAATPGPWEDYENDCDEVYTIIAPSRPITMIPVATIEYGFDGRVGTEAKPNVTFIAHARTDIPALIAEVRRLRASQSPTSGEIDARDKWKTPKCMYDGNWPFVWLVWVLQNNRPQMHVACTSDGELARYVPDGQRSQVLHDGQPCLVEKMLVNHAFGQSDMARVTAALLRRLGDAQ